jgi:hypothetical protein
MARTPLYESRSARLHRCWSPSTRTIVTGGSCLPLGVRAALKSSFPLLTVQMQS